MPATLPEEDLGLYAEVLDYLPDNLSLSDVATLLECYEYAIQEETSWGNIREVYKYQDYFFFTTVNFFDGTFDLFTEIRQRFIESPISVTNANLVAPRGLSRGISPVLPPAEDAEETETGFLLDSDVTSLPATVVAWVLREKETGRKVPIDLHPKVLGRSKNTDFQVNASYGVSRRHAEVQLTSSGPQIRDLGSANGTFVDGVRITQTTPLTEGSIINLYDKSFTLERA